MLKAAIQVIRCFVLFSINYFREGFKKTKSMIFDLILANTKIVKIGTNGLSWTKVYIG